MTTTFLTSGFLGMMIDMIILSEPDDISKYYCADGTEAFELHRAGFIPKYKWDDCIYFALTKKLLKHLADKGVEL